MGIESRQLNRKKLTVDDKLICIYEVDEIDNIIFIKIIEPINKLQTIKDLEEIAVFLINKINGTNINMLAYLNI